MRRQNKRGHETKMMLVGAERNHQETQRTKRNESKMMHKTTRMTRKRTEKEKAAERQQRQNRPEASQSQFGVGCLLRLKETDKKTDVIWSRPSHISCKGLLSSRSTRTLTLLLGRTAKPSGSPGCSRSRCGQRRCCGRSGASLLRRTGTRRKTMRRLEGQKNFYHRLRKH